MKNIVNFEGFGAIYEAEKPLPTDIPGIKKEIQKKLKNIEDIANAILGAKDLEEKIKAMSKESPESLKMYKGYIDLAKKSQKLIKDIKKVGMASNRRKAEKQMKALKEFESEIQEGFKFLKSFNKKTDKGFEQKEGLLNIAGDALRSVLTGQFIVNIIKNTKQNLTDSYTDMKTVKDVFDINA